MSSLTIFPAIRAASEWTPHSSFPGVAMQTLLSGADSNGAISQHLVRVDPGCALETHIHAGQSELHLVLEGNAVAEVGGQPLTYREGAVTAIPADTPHSVRAGKSGIVLLATFSPAIA